MSLKNKQSLLGFQLIIRYGISLLTYAFLTPVFFAYLLFVRFTLTNLQIGTSGDELFPDIGMLFTIINVALVIFVAFYFIYKKIASTKSTQTEDRFQFIKIHLTFFVLLATITLASSFWPAAQFNFLGIGSLVIALLPLSIVMLTIYTLLNTYLENRLKS